MFSKKQNPITGSHNEQNCSSCDPLKPKGQVTFQKFSSHPSENTVFITKTNQLMAFTEIITIYYSENNIKHTHTVKGKMQTAYCTAGGM